ncbi:CGCGG family putative rSAM-modified RiPP protein [Halomarina ordinaria]|uniref:CGCGG family rSAM-modified RiPP protein n=1 Tax=Halomarina ordinaria TaxID=3033939 RepID=A0ABD5UCQ7_9EURY|nr:CGCGG family rSAM-modified RiPP protein [Halomarina sp. PSRA2]
MASHSHDHGDDHAHGETEPVTDRNHDNSWSANLEKPQYEDDLSLLKRHGIEAVEHTTSGHHVNLVTHQAHGHPEGFLYDALDDRFGDEDVQWEYIEQCGCGGHVVRVHVN